MAQIFYADKIREMIDQMDITDLLEEGFVAYSQNRVIVPPVGELILKNHREIPISNMGILKVMSFL